jgi:hypothetical protein
MYPVDDAVGEGQEAFCGWVDAGAIDQCGAERQEDQGEELSAQEGGIGITQKGTEGQRQRTWHWKITQRD